MKRNSREWLTVPVADVGKSIVAAMTAAGIEYVFFTSGSEIGFYQEAIAKAHAQGRTAPKLITVTHEHAALNAALGYAAVSGKPAVTAAHVDVGTQHYGGAVHTARHAGLPVLITAGAPPVAYPGSMRGARSGAGHIWMQQTYDQNAIVRQYMKWDHRLEYQDNAGLIVSRALQVACTEPAGPVYLSMPREVSAREIASARFPTLDQLGIAHAAAPHPAAVREIAERLVRAENPFIVVARSGRNPRTVAALAELCELLAVPVVDSALNAYLCFPMTHPLYRGRHALDEADVVVTIEVDVPWMPGPHEPPPHAYVAMIDVDQAKTKIPTLEFTADLRLTADALMAIEAIEAAARPLIGTSEQKRIDARAARWAEASRARRVALDRDAASRSARRPIDPRWLSYQIGEVIDDDCIVFDETFAPNHVGDCLRLSRPGSYFYNAGSSGGWATGAAFGAKLAAPDRDVVAVSGDGFYMFGTPTAALWSAAHYRAPFLQIVYQNRSYSTGVLRTAELYPDGYAQRGGFDGGCFDPPMDFAKEAEAAGAHGENVTDPAEIAPALRRALARVRAGAPAVVAVRLPRFLQDD